MPIAVAARAPLCHERSRIGKLLDPEIRQVVHVDESVLVDGDSDRILELSVSAPRRAPLRDEHSGGGELLDAVVALIGHVDVAIRVGSDAGRLVERTCRAAKRSPLVCERARGHELASEAGHVLVGAAARDVRRCD